MAKVYLTTTLPYVNDKPHMGHALEFVQADTVARHRRHLGDDVFFNIGTDEHGQKIALKAAEAGKDPQAYTDEYAETFKKMKGALDLSYDAFIRTTDPHHKAAAQEFWKRCVANGDIYKKKYATRYCVGCELEKTDSELDHGKCPLHPNLDVQIIDEENYFFRFSKYADVLRELYRNEQFVIPHFRLNEMVSLIEKGGLQDFSISRLKSKMSWGVEVPGDSEHVMYVWFDALVNYISTLGWPENEQKFNEFWREGKTIQFAGKDQVRQQAAMWQAMLLSADLPPTKHIFIHGFVFVDGQKMSKSLGNVIDPMAMVEKYGVDGTRYLLLRHIHPFEDSDVSWAKFDEAFNANLANGLGNLVARVMKLAEDNNVIAAPFKQPYPEPISQALSSFEFQEALNYIWGRIQFLDQKINAEEPYKLIKTDPILGKDAIQQLVHGLIEVANCLVPFMPGTAEKIKAAVAANKKPDNLFKRLD